MPGGAGVVVKTVTAVDRRDVTFDACIEIAENESVVGGGSCTKVLVELVKQASIVWKVEAGVRGLDSRNLKGAN